MNFGFTEEQEMLRDQVRKFLDQQCPIPQVRKIAAEAEGFSRQQWHQIAELGWLGLTLPAHYGGSDLEWVDLVVLLEETGRSLFPSPLISTVLAATALLELGTKEQQDRYLSRIAAGSCIATLAILDEEDYLAANAITLTALPEGKGYTLSGEKYFVQDANVADLFIVACRTGSDDSEIALALIDSHQAGISIEQCDGLDRTKRCGSLILNDVKLETTDLLGAKACGWSALAMLIDRGAIAVSAESIGVCEGILALTTQYALDRSQFGSPIGRFQGVKHPLADTYVDIECMKSLVYYAAWTVRNSPEETPFAAAKAKACAAESVTKAGVTGIQMHGAIGFTEEYDMQLFLKRSKWARPMYGDEDYHYDRVADMGGI